MSGPGEGFGIGPGAQKRRKNQKHAGLGPFRAGYPSLSCQSPFTHVKTATCLGEQLASGLGWAREGSFGHLQW